MIYGNAESERSKSGGFKGQSGLKNPLFIRPEEKRRLFLIKLRKKSKYSLNYINAIRI